MIENKTTVNQTSVRNVLHKSLKREWTDFCNIQFELSTYNPLQVKQQDLIQKRNMYQQTMSITTTKKYFKEQKNS